MNESNLILTNDGVKGRFHSESKGFRIDLVQVTHHTYRSIIINLIWIGDFNVQCYPSSVHLWVKLSHFEKFNHKTHNITHNYTPNLPKKT